MTDREKAIVMAYTGVCMLSGDEFQIFHKYVEDIMGRPIWTHEMGIESIADEIKEKSKDDFIALCKDESNSENRTRWVPVSERLPEKDGDYLVTIMWKGSYSGDVYTETNMAEYREKQKEWDCVGVIAWMPMPEPYKTESEDKE